MFQRFVGNTVIYSTFPYTHVLLSQTQTAEEFCGNVMLHCTAAATAAAVINGRCTERDQTSRQFARFGLFTVSPDTISQKHNTYSKLTNELAT